MRFAALAIVSFYLITNSLVSASKEVVSSIENDLDYDENGKLAAHYILYPADNPNCPAASFDAVDGYHFRGLKGEALQKVFPGYSKKSNACPVAAPELGTDRSLAYAVMSHRRLEDGNFKKWFQDDILRTEICLLNYHDKENPLRIYWKNSDNGELKHHLDLGYGERKTRCFASYMRHEFVVKDGSTGNIIDEFKVTHTLSRAFGESPPSGNKEGYDFVTEISEALKIEWDKHKKVKRTFSPLGFKKARLPDDVFASISSFYYNNRNYDVREEWKGKGFFVNWWETDPWFIQVPWDLKSRWQERLRELVEAWAGVPIEQTDMYGLRQYVEGARLLTHVDRVNTHAVSLIVNIAQSNLTEPWPVEVNDHMDQLHEIIMEPGDIVYYESAKALHGRNRPLTGKGAKYINIFTHYRPVGDPDWYLKENPPGTVEPLKEVEGECRLEMAGTKELPNKKLGVVQTVNCDDPRLGNTVSPALFKATSSDDLFNWWKMTGESRETTLIS